MTPLTRQQKIEAIRQNCIQANPEIEHHWKQHVCGKLAGCKCTPEDLIDRVTTREIRLSDVLLTLADEGHALGIYPTGCFFWEYEPTDIEWNLRKDSLTDQSDETLDFLIQLLPS